jgi:hypothetical protein
MPACLGLNFAPDGNSFSGFFCPKLSLPGTIQFVHVCIFTCGEGVLRTSHLF